MNFSLKPIILLLLFACSFSQTEAQSKFSQFPPINVDKQMDFEQMLHQMGIILPELPSKLSDPNRPVDSAPVDIQKPEGKWYYDGHELGRSAWGLWDNYDDTSEGFFPGRDSFRVGNYSPLPPLKMKNGQDVSTSREWWEKRRPEIVHDIQECLYGFFPPDSIMPTVKFEVVETEGGSGEKMYVQKDIVGIIDTSNYPQLRNTPRISCVLRIPKKVIKPIPVIIIYSFSKKMVERYWDIVEPHGWALCIYNPTTLQPDNGDGLTSYLIGLVNKGNWRKPTDWGTIGAWAWGISRLVDYLEKEPCIDHRAIGLAGHSRYGKAALYAMAFDNRIAIAFPSDAGSLGTAMSRRHWGQDLENSGSPTEYHWMAGNFLQWCGELIPGQYLPRKVEVCPVDAHFLVALCAPRPVFVNGGNQSHWADPYGMYKTLVYASPVYELLGSKGIVCKDEKPLLDVGYIEGKLGYRFHNGGHTDIPDWPSFFEFAEKTIGHE